MLQHNIPLHLKKVEKNIILCTFLFLSFSGELWFLTDFLFTSDNYNLALVLIVLLSLITFLNETFVFYGNYFDQMNLVKWKI